MRACGHCRKPGHRRDRCPECAAPDLVDDVDNLDARAKIRARIDALDVSIAEHVAVRAKIDRILDDERIEKRLAEEALAELRSRAIEVLA